MQVYKIIKRVKGLSINKLIIICFLYNFIGNYCNSQQIETANYFPLLVGSTFKYYYSGPCPPKKNINTGDFYSGNKVYDSVTISGKKYFTFQTAHFQIGIDTVRIDENKDVIIRRRGNDLVYYRLNGKPGDKWIYYDTLGGNEWKWNVKLASRNDTINVGAGTFYNCLRFEFTEWDTNVPYSGMSIPHTDWLALNVGLVFRCMPGAPFELTEAIIGDKKYPLTNIQENKLYPEDFVIYQNYPNPFNPETIIKYDIKKRSMVKLIIYDITGKEVNCIYEGIRESGSYMAKWDGKDKTGKQECSGTYFYCLQEDNNYKVKKMMLLK